MTLYVMLASSVNQRAVKHAARGKLHARMLRHMHADARTLTDVAVAERAIGIMKNTARAASFSGSLQPQMWFLAAQMACYVLQYVPTNAFDKQLTLYERRYNHPPSVSHLRSPGCLVWFYNYEVNKKSFLDKCAKAGVMVGYDLFSRSYKIYNLESKRVLLSSDCVFNEAVYPLADPNARALQPRRDTDITQINQHLWGEDDTNTPAEQVQNQPDRDNYQDNEWVCRRSGVISQR